jgi:hypothetical protein
MPRNTANELTLGAILRMACNFGLHQGATHVTVYRGVALVSPQDVSTANTLFELTLPHHHCLPHYIRRNPPTQLPSPTTL